MAAKHKQLFLLTILFCLFIYVDNITKIKQQIDDDNENKDEQDVTTEILGSTELIEDTETTESTATSEHGETTEVQFTTNQKVEDSVEDKTDESHETSTTFPDTYNNYTISNKTKAEIEREKQNKIKQIEDMLKVSQSFTDRIGELSKSYMVNGSSNNLGIAKDNSVVKAEKLIDKINNPNTKIMDKKNPDKNVQVKKEIGKSQKEKPKNKKGAKNTTKGFPSSTSTTEPSEVTTDVTPKGKPTKKNKKNKKKSSEKEKDIDMFSILDF